MKKLGKYFALLWLAIIIGASCKAQLSETVKTPLLPTTTHAKDISLSNGAIKLTTFDLTVMIPIFSGLFVAVVLCILFIFKSQTRHSKEWQAAKDKDDKKRDETLGFLQKNLIILQTSHDIIAETHKMLLEKNIS